MVNTRIEVKRVNDLTYCLYHINGEVIFTGTGATSTLAILDCIATVTKDTKEEHQRNTSITYGRNLFLNMREAVEELTNTLINAVTKY